MSFLDRLLGRRPNPTLTWNAEMPPMPDFDLAQMSFGPLRFGDPIEAASFLGRPDHFEWIRPKYCTLLYASRGFQIDFEESRFVYVGFLIGPDAYLPKQKPIQFSEPRLTGLTPARSGSRAASTARRSNVGLAPQKPRTSMPRKPSSGTPA